MTVENGIRNGLVVPVLLAVGLSASCAPAEPEFDAPSVAALLDAGSAEELGLLLLVNDPSVSYELLDDDVGLDRRAARGIVDRRPFESFADLDAVPYVGAVAIEKLLRWSSAAGFADRGAAEQRALALAVANDPSSGFEVLDVEVGLDRRAATNIVEFRAGADGRFGSPDDRQFASFAELDAVPYVGDAAVRKMVVYARSESIEPGDPTESRPCVIISEVIEGPGANNKALELTNCGESAIELSRVGVCVVQNDDRECSRSARAGEGQLAAGSTWVLCRTRSGTVSDPYAPLAAACQQELGSVANFNGDDRLQVFLDENGDAQLSEGEPVLDGFGDPEVRPASTPWAEIGFRRCDLSPAGGPGFDVDAHFTRHGSTTFSHLGQPPLATCGAGAELALEGELCLSTDVCAEGLRCVGKPTDGSSPFGRCVDLRPIAGQGDRCDRFAPCAPDLICVGWTIFGEGECSPLWMSTRERDEVSRSVPDAPAGGISPWVVVQGQASVPVDLEVVVHLDHPRPSDLVITLIDPNGTEAILWDRDPSLGSFARSFALSGISRDDQVNGRWSLSVRDVVSGEAGTLDEWSLMLTSRWD